MSTALDFSSKKNLYNNLLKELKRVYKKMGKPVPERNEGIIYLEELPLIQRLSLNFSGCFSIDINNEPFISHLTDLRKISLCKPYQLTGKELSQIKNKNAITSIEIIGSDLTTLDLSQFPNLESLTLVDNESLREIKGLENIKKLEEIVYYNNPLVNETTICNFLTSNMKRNTLMELDILLYPKITSIIKHGYSAYRDSFRQSTWVKVTNTIKHTVEETGNIYSHIEDIIDKIIPRVTDDYEAAYIMYCYVRSHVAYDFDSLNDKLRMRGTKVTLNFGGKPQEIRMSSGKKGGANSAFNALFSRYAVCEGYTKLLQMFYKLYGLDCYNILAHGSDLYNPNAKAPTAQELYNGEVNHSIIQVIINDNTYYCDTTNESYDPKTGKVGQKCFLRTFEELTTNWYPVRRPRPPYTEPLSTEFREELDKVKIADNEPVDAKKRAETIMDKFDLHLAEGPNLDIEFQVKKEQLVDLLLLRVINRSVKQIIENTIFEEYLSLRNGVTKR